jgi:type IV secretory pathway VirB9-like protein
LENVTQADEIELLERKLEYLRAKKELDLELEIVKAKLQKLNQDYSDVVDTKAAVSASSTSEAPETSEPTEPVKVEEAPAKVASSKGADREWVAEYTYCQLQKQEFKDIKIDEDGTFSWNQFDGKKPNGWLAFLKGNLKHNEAEVVKDKSRNTARLKSIKAEQDGEAWNVTINWGWPGGGCRVKTVITRK